MNKNDFLNKYKINVIEFKIDEDNDDTFHTKELSYNVTRELAKYNHIPEVQMLAIVKFCLCDDDGNNIFDSTDDLSFIGSCLGYEVVATLGQRILQITQENNKLKKKPKS